MRRKRATWTFGVRWTVVQGMPGGNDSLPVIGASSKLQRPVLSYDQRGKLVDEST